jgi:hypothetical protein
MVPGMYQRFTLSQKRLDQSNVHGDTMHGTSGMPYLGTVHVYVRTYVHVYVRTYVKHTWFSVHMCALFRSESCDITLWQYKYVRTVLGGYAAVQHMWFSGQMCARFQSESCGITLSYRGTYTYPYVRTRCTYVRT